MKLECQHCGMVGEETQFPPAKDLHLRNQPGDMFSDQECPDCGALAFPHITDAEKKLAELREFVELIARMKTLGEIARSEELYSDDDAVETLDELIASARKITGIDPKKEEK